MKSGQTLILKQAFSGVDNDTLLALKKVANRQSYPSKTILCRQGEKGHTFYIVVEGRVSVIQQIDVGEQRLLGILGPNAVFGEMSLIDDSPRMATVETLTPTTVLEIDENMFDRLMATSPAVAYRIIRNVLENARRSDQQSIKELQEKNISLEHAYETLQAAQAEIIEKERLDREIELAAAVQQNLLPGALPSFPDYHFAAYLTPARRVGGDFYDVIPIDDEHVGILIADVADKGFHAALFMAVTRTLFMQESKRSLSPGRVAQAVHQGMLAVAKTDDAFVTAFYAVLHRSSGLLTYVRAGHDRPLLFRPGHKVTSLPGNGRFLGMLPDLELTEASIRLQPGDRLLLFSDGVPDAVNMADEPYGNNRLAEIMASVGELTASEIVSAIAKDVLVHCQEAAPFDDLTMVVVEVKDGRKPGEG